MQEEKGNNINEIYLASCKFWKEKMHVCTYILYCTFSFYKAYSNGIFFYFFFIIFSCGNWLIYT